MKVPTIFKLASTSMLAIALFFCFQSTSFASKRDTAESKRYFKQGQSYFENGEYAESLASFQMAYHYKKLSGFHFNMAQCQMELGDYKSALKNYKAYLDAKPGASNATLVETRILEAKSKLGLLNPKPKPKKIAKTAAAPKTKAKPPTKRAKAKSKASPKKPSIAATPSAPKPASAKLIQAAPPPPAAAVTTTEPTLIPLIPAKAKKMATTKPSKSKTASKANNPKPPKKTAGRSSDEAEVIAATLDTGAPNADLVATQAHPDILASAPPSSSMDEPIYEEWWFWSVTGSVVAASVGAIIYAASSEPEPVVVLPSGSLGRIDRR